MFLRSVYFQDPGRDPPRDGLHAARLHAGGRVPPARHRVAVVRHIGRADSGGERPLPRARQRWPQPLARLDPRGGAAQGPPGRRVRAARRVHGRRGGGRSAQRLARPAVRCRSHAHRRARARAWRWPRSSWHRAAPRAPTTRSACIAWRSWPRSPTPCCCAAWPVYVLVEAVGRFDDPPSVRHRRAARGGRASGWPPTSSPSRCSGRGPRSRSTCRAPTSRCSPTPSARSAVILAALLIRATGWGWVDPAVGVAIGLWILPRTLRLAAQAVRVLVQAAPAGRRPRRALLGPAGRGRRARRPRPPRVDAHLGDGRRVSAPHGRRRHRRARCARPGRGSCSGSATASITRRCRWNRTTMRAAPRSPGSDGAPGRADVPGGEARRYGRRDDRAARPARGGPPRQSRRRSRVPRARGRGSTSAPPASFSRVPWPDTTVGCTAAPRWPPRSPWPSTLRAGRACGPPCSSSPATRSWGIGSTARRRCWPRVAVPRRFGSRLHG